VNLKIRNFIHMINSITIYVNRFLFLLVFMYSFENFVNTLCFKNVTLFIF